MRGRVGVALHGLLGLGAAHATAARAANMVKSFEETMVNSEVL